MPHFSLLSPTHSLYLPARREGRGERRGKKREVEKGRVGVERREERGEEGRGGGKGGEEWREGSLSPPPDTGNLETFNILVWFLLPFTFTSYNSQCSFPQHFQLSDVGFNI